jgi:protein-S-isoprenylcysteine O-methyltransferase Ste14
MIVAAVAGGSIWLVARTAPAGSVEFGLRREVAFTLLIAGFAVAIAGVVSFRRARTTVNPLNPEKSSALVVSGIFRWTRNPMYLGVLVCLLGVVVWFGSVPALLVPVVFVAYIDRFQIVPEETALRARFGEEFESYRARVRRWI